MPATNWPVSAPVPSTSAFDQTKDPCTCKPCENRFVTFVWSESYHVLPIGGPRETNGIVVHWGTGRICWATVWLVGIPAYAGKNPRAAACGEPIRLVSNERSAGFERLSP